jgi:predicted PurR-regulated permease PerM
MGEQRADTTQPQEPPAGGATPLRAPVQKVVVPRWVQLVALPLLVLAVYALARAAGPVLLIFTIAAVIALILNPIVVFLQGPPSRRIPRGVAIFVVYAGFFTVLALAGLLLANPIADQVNAFRDDVPSIVDSANERLADLQDTFDERGIDIQLQEQGQTALETLQDRVVGGTGEVVAFGTDLLETIVRAGFGLILVFVISIYMLLYGPRIGAIVRSVMPPGDGTSDDDYPTRVTRAVAGYVRGQLLFSLAMGTGAGVGLYVFGALGIFPQGKTYALAFATWFGFMELIPYVGPILGAMPPVLVAFFGDPLTGLWVALLFVALQQIEGHVVAPTIFGHTLRINPLFVIFALLLGAEVYGIVGALVALPILAVVRETVAYLAEHLELEPWGAEEPVGLLTAARGMGGAGARATCPECDAPAQAQDAFCRRCGAPLRRTEVRSGA